MKPNDVRASPATRWAFPIPWALARLRRRRGELGASRMAALLAMLAEDLRRAHHRLALRHYLMLTRSGEAVPDPLAEECERLWFNCNEVVRQRIAADVDRWLTLVRSP